MGTVPILAINYAYISDTMEKTERLWTPSALEYGFSLESSKQSNTPHEHILLLSQSNSQKKNNNLLELANLISQAKAENTRLKKDQTDQYYNKKQSVFICQLILF